MDLLGSVADWVLAELPFDRSDPKVLAALKAKHPGELLVLYHNWCSRLISPQPRCVLCSDAFEKNPLVAQRSEAVAAITKDIEQGNDLTKYLSRRVRTGFQLPPNPAKKKLNRLEHLDLLVNEWRIYHLHLSTTVEPDGFVERKRDDPLLLFAMFMPGKAYYLDIGTHASFADDELVKIAVRNWPSDQLFIELKGVLGPRAGNSYSSEERKKLRAAGLSTFIQIGDQMFSSPGGISSAGTTSRATLWANRIMRKLKEFDEHVQADSSKIAAFIREHGGTPGDPPEFQFSLFQDGFGVIEKASNFPITLQR